MNTPTEEVEAIELPKREMVSSYENLRGNAKEPKLECRIISIRNASPDKAPMPEPPTSPGVSSPTQTAVSIPFGRCLAMISSAQRSN